MKPTQKLEPEDVQNIIQEFSKERFWDESDITQKLCEYISAVSTDHGIGWAVTESTLRRFFRDGKIED